MACYLTRVLWVPTAIYLVARLDTGYLNLSKPQRPYAQTVALLTDIQGFNPDGFKVLATYLGLVIRLVSFHSARDKLIFFSSLSTSLEAL